MLPGRAHDPLFGWLVREAREAQAHRSWGRTMRSTEMSWPGD